MSGPFKRLASFARSAGILAVVLLAAYGARTWLGLSGLGMGLATLWIFVLVLYVAHETRLEAIEERAGKGYQELADRLRWSKRIEPVHDPAPHLPNRGRVGPDDIAFFDATAGYGEIANLLLKQTAWSVHETPQTEVKGYDQPEVGRVFALFHGDVRLGRVQLMAKPRIFSTETVSGGYFDVSVDSAKLIPYEDVHHLLTTLHSLADDETEGTLDRSQRFAEQYLLPYLWNSVRAPDSLHELEAHGEGTFGHLFGIEERRHDRRVRGD